MRWLPSSRPPEKGQPGVSGAERCPPMGAPDNPHRTPAGCVSSRVQPRATHGRSTKPGGMRFGPASLDR